jgi:hypothetical protein
MVDLDALNNFVSYHFSSSNHLVPQKCIWFRNNTVSMTDIGAPPRQDRTMQVLHSATDTADPPRQTKIGYLHRPLSCALAVTTVHSRDRPKFPLLPYPLGHHSPLPSIPAPPHRRTAAYQATAPPPIPSIPSQDLLLLAHTMASSSLPET